MWPDALKALSQTSSVSANTGAESAVSGLCSLRHCSNVRSASPAVASRLPSRSKERGFFITPSGSDPDCSADRSEGYRRAPTLNGVRVRPSTTASRQIGQTPECFECGYAISLMARCNHPNDRANMTTSETGQPQHETIGAAAMQARRAAAVMFFASLVVMIGASLGLGFLLGRASSVPSGGATPTSVGDQSPAIGAAKNMYIKATILPSKVNEETFAATVDRPANTTVSQELFPNDGPKESGAELRSIAKSQVLAADFAYVGAIQQPVPLEAKEEPTATIFNPASDFTVDAPSRNAQHWLKLAEEVRHQAEELRGRPGSACY